MGHVTAGWQGGPDADCDVAEEFVVIELETPPPGHPKELKLEGEKAQTTRERVCPTKSWVSVLSVYVHFFEDGLKEVEQRP